MSIVNITVWGYFLLYAFCLMLNLIYFFFILLHRYFIIAFKTQYLLVELFMDFNLINYFNMLIIICIMIIINAYFNLKAYISMFKIFLYKIYN